MIKDISYKTFYRLMIVLSLFIFEESTIYCQYKWQRIIGGNGGEEPITLTKTSNGYILGAYSGSDSSFDRTQNTDGYKYCKYPLFPTGCKVIKLCTSF